MHALYCTLKVAELANAKLSLYRLRFPLCTCVSFGSRSEASALEVRVSVCALVWLWFNNLTCLCDCDMFGVAHHQSLLVKGGCFSIGSLSLCLSVCVCVLLQLLWPLWNPADKDSAPHTHTHTLNATDAGQRNSKWWHVSHVRANRFSHMKVTGCF